MVAFFSNLMRRGPFDTSMGKRQEVSVDKKRELGRFQESSSALTLPSSRTFMPEKSETSFSIPPDRDHPTPSPFTRHNPAPKSDLIIPNQTDPSMPQHKRYSPASDSIVPKRTHHPTMSPLKPRFSMETSLRLITPEEEELGAIRYQSTCLDDAKKEAMICKKPILCVEVDIPGDVRTSREVLSHPLIVEAAETLFVSVLCRMQKVPVNVPGKHCYTKVRILNDDGMDLVAPVMGKSLCIAKVASTMIEALSVCSQDVPTYLQLLEEEHSAWGTREGPSGCLRRIERQAVFGMACSKRGEVEFAGLDGVIATRAGYYNGSQVVRVTYDSRRLSYCSLVRYALERDVAKTICFQTTDERVVGIIELKRYKAKADLVQFDGVMQLSVDPKHALRKTMLRFVPLTELQSARANRLCDMGAFNEAVHLLSPRQGQFLMRSLRNSKNEDVTDVPIVSAWKSLSDDAAKQTSQ